jgi:hypothetical protein
VTRLERARVVEKLVVATGMARRGCRELLRVAEEWGGELVPETAPTRHRDITERLLTQAQVMFDILAELQSVGAELRGA